MLTHIAEEIKFNTQDMVCWDKQIIFADKVLETEHIRMHTHKVYDVIPNLSLLVINISK